MGWGFAAQQGRKVRGCVVFQGEDSVADAFGLIAGNNKGGGGQEFAGHANIQTTALYFIRKEEDAEVAARRIQIRSTSKGHMVNDFANVLTGSNSST